MAKKQVEELEPEETLTVAEAIDEVTTIMDELDSDEQQGVIGYLRGRYPRAE